MEEKILNLLSMAARARRVTSGMTLTVEAVKKGEAKLLLLANDASEDTKKDVHILAEKNSLNIYEILNKNALGSIIGKEERAVVAVLDEGFSKAFEKIII